MKIRALDLALTAPGLLLAAPLYVAIAVVIRVTDGGPVLFRQERVGRGGKPFTLLKFRSMREEVGGVQVTASGDSRVTRTGHVLRRTKLDELPELWNVLRGEMSLVGPRPEVPRYARLSDPRWVEVLEMRPGITDPVTLSLRNEEELLARVEGDREAFYEEVLLPFKLAGYREYGLRRTLWSDLKVLVKTALAIILPSRTPPPDLLGI